MGVVKIRTLGLKGVNVDKNPLVLDEDEVQQAQNFVSEQLGNVAGVVNRPGLVAFSEDGGDAVLGGVGLVTAATGLSINGVLFLGRGGENA